LRAAGPQGGGDQNPYWPNNAPQWGQHFPPRAAAAIAEYVADVVGSVDGSADAKAVSDSITEYMKDAATAISKSVQSVVGPVKLRVDLLWWKEAGYSESTRIGYIHVPAEMIPLVAAIDLSMQVPMFCPVAVEFFLSAVCKTALAGRKPAPLSLIEFSNSVLANLGNYPAVAEFLAKQATWTGRATLLSALTLAVRDKSINSEPYLARALGQTVLEHKFESPDIGLWLFREVQVGRLTDRGRR
jgi:hypothetical protein